MSTPLSALLLSIVIVPLSVVCHELGHFFSDIAFGFDSPTLHYASSGFARESEFWAMVRAGDLAAASEIARVTHAGISSALGLLISYLLVGMGLWGPSVSRHRCWSRLPLWCCSPRRWVVPPR